MKGKTLKNTILYLDKTNEHLEQELMDQCPDDLKLKFLYPAIGNQGSIEEADYIINSIYPIDKAMIDKAHNLRMIQRTGVGYDNVDVVYAKQKNIPVCIAVNCLSDSVAELIVLHILAIYRKLQILHNETQKCHWNNWTYKHESFELKGKKVGVIGAGRIGKALMKKLSGFEPDGIVYFDPFSMSPEEENQLKAVRCDLDDLMRTSDIVSLSLPWTEESRNLIDARRINLLKPNAVLVNTSRGGIVDNYALSQALRERKILGAGIDVYSKEPVLPDDPLLGLDNVVTTPHIGSSTIDCYRKVCRLCMENIKMFHKGSSPLYIVNYP
jgi:phosphoglycerate dehydrogenase-like enzyme